MERRAYSGRNTPNKKVMRRSGKPTVLHCMIIPTEQETLLLPTSVMAEVIDFQPPRPTESAPPWLLGQIDWEDRQVPVVEQVEDQPLVVAELLGRGPRASSQPGAQLRGEPLAELCDWLDVGVLRLEVAPFVPDGCHWSEAAPQGPPLVLHPLWEEGIAHRKSRHGPEKVPFGLVHESHGGAKNV